MASESTGIASDQIQLSSIEEAHWPEDHFYFITFGAVLEHLHDPALCNERALSWLKPGGVIHAEVPSSDFLPCRLLNSFYRLIGTSYLANCSPMHTPYHLYEFRPQGCESLGSRLGFRLDEYSYRQASARFVPHFLYPLFFRWMMATHTGMQLNVWLRKPKG